MKSPEYTPTPQTQTREKLTLSKGITALVAAAVALAGCMAKEHEYSGGDTRQYVAAGTNVYEAGHDAVKCGETSADATVIPVGEYVTEGNRAGNGGIQRYEFEIGGDNGLPLKDGHSCDETVFVYNSDASPVAPSPGTPTPSS